MDQPRYTGDHLVLDYCASVEVILGTVPAACASRLFPAVVGLLCKWFCLVARLLWLQYVYANRGRLARRRVYFFTV